MARPAGHGSSWEALAQVWKDEITAWVQGDLTLVKVDELLERSGDTRFRTGRWPGSRRPAECGYLRRRGQG